MTETDEQYLRTLKEQIELRESSPRLDITHLQELLRSKQHRFGGDLVFFAASDFGRPVALVPRSLDDPRAALNLILDKIHERPSEGGKWSGEHVGLREVKNELCTEVTGIHKAFPALIYDDDSVDYDITAGDDDQYRFVTIRQVVGLVDWCANSFQAGELISHY